VIAAGIRHRRRRAVVAGIGLTIVAFVLFCISLSVGDFPIPLTDVVPAVFGLGDADSHFIIHTLRLPRALTGVLVGAAFGMSGAIFQTMTRNALASPDIIGISSGATTAAVLAIVVFSAGSAFVAGAALVGAVLTFLAIYLLAWKRGVSSYRLVLVGIGVSAVCTGVTQYLLTRAEIYEAQRAAVWFTGSLNGRGWEHVRPLVVALAVLIPAALWLCRPLRALQLGDDTARGLGARVEWSRGSLLLVAVAMVAAATASAGPVSFAPFVCGPIARRLTRGTGLNLVPAALTGVVLLLSADLIGRRLFAPTELPVGLITGVIGGSYLIWLLARTNKSGKGG
jgi:iron complex transport system permease protein